MQQSLRNIKLTLEYDGTHYNGWQCQCKAQNAKCKIKTIQETIEKALQKILQEKTRLIVAGRTDAGVHAQAQVVNFKTKSKIPLKNIQLALNSSLPKDIIITNIKNVSLDFHSQHDTKSKIYRYTILNRKYSSALLERFVYFYPYYLDIKLMQQEARYLIGIHNFKSFCVTKSCLKDNIRTIKRISVKKINDLIYIEIEADGFLHNMVRNIAGTLIEIGRGRFKKGYLKSILLGKNRVLAGPCIPAKGLCLMRVNY
ncbi:MAG: tRNA pseudouridine(38-40) synthase TruA [Candidatus Omnitrophota bacterium]